jgi:PAS domain S-box-containing protein
VIDSQTISLVSRQRKLSRAQIFKYFFAQILLLFAISNAQAERLPVKAFTSADGLGSSFVNSLMRDSRGFLWFATRDGLSRFDGSRFVTYQVGIKDAPPGIEQIFETSKGIYWIATTNGLYRFDPNLAPAAVQTKPTDRPILNAEYINDRRGRFTEDNDGKLWFISEDLNLLEEQDGKVSMRKVELNLPGLPEASLGVTGFRQAQDGSFWIASKQGVIRRLPGGRDIFYRVENTRTDIFTSVMEDNAGRIWLIRSSSIYVFKPEPLGELAAALENLTIRNLDALAQVHAEKQISLPEKPGEFFKYTAVEGLENNPTEFLYKSLDGHIWISTREGIIEFDGQAFHFYSAAQGFAGGNGKMVEDLDGNLWLGGDKNLLRLDRSGLTTYDSADGFETPGILAIGESRDGKLYAASSGFVVNQFDGKKFQAARPQLPPDARGIWNSNTVLLDSQNEWWFLTSEHLYRFAPANDFAALAGAKPLAIYDTANSLADNSMYRSFEDKQGDVWISTRAAPDAVDARFSLAKFDRRTQTFQTFSKAENFPARKSASAFAEDSAGNLWIGFYEGGLVKYSGGRFTEVTEGVPAGLITALYIDQKGRLWLATSLSGISRIDDPGAESLQFISYKIENGLSGNNVRSITEDNFGRIYAGTARGIDRISPETGQIKHYSTADGLAGDFVSTAFRDRQGILWFGTPNGLSRLAPERDAKILAPPIWLSGLRIAGEARSVSELGAAEISNLELAPDQNNLQIDFFGLDFSPNESLRYQYMLEGADKDWSAPVEQRTVNFSNLSAGDYKFLVRAVNADGVRSETPATVSFKLLPPIYARWWFIAGAIFLTGAGVFALDRFRVSKTRQVKTALDVSRKSEQIARESETRYRTLTETASDAIITIDEASKIIYVNEAVEEMFGYKPEEIVGKNLTVLMPERFRPQHNAGISWYLQTSRKQIAWTAVELPGAHKSGAEIPLELSFGEFEKDGQRFFTGIARDISERKKAEAALVKAREERFAELERVRKRIATDLHDDIGSSLTQISLLSEVVNQRISTYEKRITEPLGMIAETSRELIDSMADIVWAINPQKDTLSDLMGRMHRFAADVLTAANINLNWHAPDASAEIPIGANVRREIFLIFKESVNNTVKHSKCTEAHLEIRLSEKNLELTLGDNGSGFDVSGESDGHGLASMKERAGALGGDFEIVSHAEKGTTVFLKVPLAKPQPPV